MAFADSQSVTLATNVHHVQCTSQAARVLDDYQYGRDFIDPSHVKDGGVTKDHTRQWKVLQELQVSLLHCLSPCVCVSQTVWFNSLDIPHCSDMPYSSNTKFYVYSPVESDSSLSSNVVMPQCCCRIAMRPYSTRCCWTTSPPWRPLCTLPQLAGHASTITSYTAGPEACSSVQMTRMKW